MTAYDAGDAATLRSLCRRQQDLIERSFPAWWDDRPSLDDMAALNHHMQVLGTIAMVFDQELGRPNLLASVMGNAETNPLLWAQKRLREGQAALAAGRYEVAETRGREVLDKLATVRGTIEEERAEAFELVGTAAFLSGNVDRAASPLLNAVDVWLTAGRLPPLPLLLNQFDVYRYLDDPEAAARVADLLSDNFEVEPSLFYRRQAAILRDGEPLLRPIARIGNQRFEIDDAIRSIKDDGSTFRPSIELRRNRPTIDAASRELARGAELASDGLLHDGLVAFEAAARIDPYDPSPHYQLGVALLDLERWTEAGEAFGRAEALAPGWFYTRRYRWLVNLVARGDVSARTPRILIRTDDPGEPMQRLARLAEAREHDPDLGVIYLYAGQAFAEMGQPDDAAQAYRQGIAARLLDDDVRCALGVELGMRDLHGAGRALLERAVLSNANPASAGMARLALGLSA
jgi:tetratricopeptide (TPR) repeat protein